MSTPCVHLLTCARYAPGDRVIVTPSIRKGVVKAVSSPDSRVRADFGPGDQYHVVFDDGTSETNVHEDLLRPESSKVTASYIRHLIKKGRKTGKQLPDELVTAFRIASSQPTHKAPSAQNIALITVKKTKKVVETVTSTITAVGALRVTKQRKVTRTSSSKTITASTTSIAAKQIKACSRASCINAVYKRGLCKTHFASYRKKNAFT